MSKVGVFVDCVDQYYTVKRKYNAKLSYLKYMEKAIKLSKGEIVQSVAYGVQLDNEASKFISTLKFYGYEPKYRKAEIYDGRPDIKSTNVYIKMFADIMRALDNIDIIVIGSSDRELIPMLQYIKERKIEVILLSCSISEELASFTDISVEITRDMLEC